MKDALSLAGGDSLFRGRGLAMGRIVSREEPERGEYDLLRGLSDEQLRLVDELLARPGRRALPAHRRTRV